jgi:hypothetical protein
MIRITEILLLDPDVTEDQIGMIPFWVDPADKRPAKEQLHEHYAHGGGWDPQPGFTLNQKTGALKYPGDPPLLPLAALRLRDELIAIYPYGYVCIMQPDGKFEACRMD